MTARVDDALLMLFIGFAIERRLPIDDEPFGCVSWLCAYCIKGLVSRWVALAAEAALALSEGEGDGPDWECGEGTSDKLNSPNLSSALWSTTAASAGSSQRHFLARTLRITRVRLAHGQSSAISSRWRTP